MPKTPPTTTPRFIPAMYFDIARCAYSDGYEFSAKVCFIETAAVSNDDCHLGKLTGFALSFGLPDKWRELENFQFHAWINDDGSAYGCGPSWEAGSYVKLDEVARMAKASARIERGLERIRQARGYTGDTADWFGRVAEVIGCNLFLDPFPATKPSRSGYRYRVYESLGDAINHVRCRLEEIKRLHADA
jgi:hypothetical protein